LLSSTVVGFFIAPAAGLGPQSDASLVAAERLDLGRRKTTPVTTVTGSRDDGGRITKPLRILSILWRGFGGGMVQGQHKQQQQNAAERTEGNSSEVPNSSSTN
jgi:hypothetical protein